MSHAPTPITHRVLVIEAHAAMREALCQYLASRPDFTVVASTGDWNTAEPLIRRLRPDIILLGLLMPRPGTLSRVQTWSRRKQGPRIVAVVGNASTPYLRQLVWAGVAGIVDGHCSLPDLEKTLQTAALGRTRQLLPLNHDSVLPTVGKHPGPSMVLTQREKTVLQEIASGFSNKEIADHLKLSVYTIENHRANLRRKLGLGSVQQLVIFALQAGLIDWP